MSHEKEIASALFLMRACVVNGFSWDILSKVLEHEYERAVLAKDVKYLDVVASMVALTKTLRGLHG